MKKLLCLLSCLACFSSLSFANESPQALQDAFMAALKANDVQGLADCYSSNAVNFPVDSLVGRGPESALASWSGFFAAFKVIDARLSEDITANIKLDSQLRSGTGIFTLDGSYACRHTEARIGRL